MHLNREVNNLKSQLEEQERDADDILKKYQNHIQNVNTLFRFRLNLVPMFQILKYSFNYYSIHLTRIASST